VTWEITRVSAAGPVATLQEPFGVPHELHRLKDGVPASHQRPSVTLVEEVSGRRQILPQKDVVPRQYLGDGHRHVRNAKNRVMVCGLKR
jgi:hypothetical protein